MPVQPLFNAIALTSCYDIITTCRTFQAHKFTMVGGR